MTAFGVWLLRQVDRHDVVGDLARDYAGPCPCQECEGRTSRRYSPTGVRAELDGHDAIPAAYEALDLAEAEWRACRRAGAVT